MATSTRSALTRTSQAYYAQLGHAESLDLGIAFYSRTYPDLGVANQFRETIISDAAQLPVAYEAVERFFAENGSRCRRWAPAVDFDPDLLSTFLLQQGFHEVSAAAMRLDQWPKLDEPNSSVRILPARAMQQAFRSTFTPECVDGNDLLDRLIDSEIDRLDNASLEMFVALKDRKPVGRAGLFLVGDIARVLGPYVLPEARDMGIAVELLRHLLVLAQRLAPRLICAEVPKAAPPMQALFEASGFLPDGLLVEFHRP